MRTDWTRAPRARTAGFTLLEVLVVLALVAGLAAIVVPSLFGRAEREAVEATAESLVEIGEAVHDPRRGAGSFRSHVGAYPGALDQLTRPITTGDLDSCGDPFDATEAALWAGPYLSRMPAPDGLPLPIGRASPALTRTLDGAAGDPVLTMTVAAVHLDDAAALDVLLDGSDDPSAGAVRYGAPDPDGFVDLDYLIPMDGC